MRKWKDCPEILTNHGKAMWYKQERNNALDLLDWICNSGHDAQKVKEARAILDSQRVEEPEETSTDRVGGHSGHIDMCKAINGLIDRIDALEARK